MGQSEEILAHVKSLFPEKDTFLYRNYPNFKPIIADPIIASKGKIKMVYAGLLGVAQGVYKLIQKLDFSTIEFHIYGAGAEKEKIEYFISKHPELPIVYHGEVDRKSLHKKLLDYDVAIIPLLNRIYGSVPSKIFEYAYLGLPLLYFGGGEGEQIIEKYHLGWVAESGNYKELNRIISAIQKSDLNSTYSKAIINTSIKEFDFINQLKNLEKLL
jgi:glycosyltransferase involved in cell wall biosynthesis